MKFAHPNRRKKGFTLIEILVVIAIIGILSSLVFAGATGVVNSAKKTDARNTAYNVKNSVSAYFTEYRKMPKPDGAGSTEHADFPTDENFMDILLAADSDIGLSKNPRGITFFSARAAKRLGANAYVKGIASTGNDGGGSLWDPYGRQFGVRMDVENKGRMKNPNVTAPSLSGGNGSPEWGSGGSAASQSDYVNEQVIVWSAGKETSSSTDNITTFD